LSTTLIHLIAGARPNFMKVAPLFHTLSGQDWCRPAIVHTGQHYDAQMSDAFFADLRLPAPDVNLGVGSGSHAEQTARIMIAYEEICRDARPDWVVVVGDVNSTVACALVAAKLCIPLAHLEAGLRSRDRTMPEEINRLVTDTLADALWTPSPDADENLRREGVPEERIARVGNIMIDAYEMLRPRIEAERAPERHGLAAQGYAVLTLHRPSNVDRPEVLAGIVEQLKGIAARLPLVFAVHPRTSARLREFGLWEGLRAAPGMVTADPMSYVEFMSLVREARLAITDSGGIQEETTYLGIPCLTLRDTTERPITISQGTNRLVRIEELVPSVERVLAGDWPTGRCPELWDGQTAPRVAADLKVRCGKDQ
jgi:UDP-N-acetylglucosamine 2-epimerase (non-hydrolysing)